MVYTFKLVNPLASCNHIGGNDMDLLMEAVVSTPAETPASSLGNGDLSTQAAGGDHRSGDGGVGGAPTGANGGGAGASAGTSSSQQQPPTSDNEEVDDISSDDEDDDDDVDHDGGGDGGDKDEDSVVSDDADALIGTLHQPGGTEPRSTAAGGVAGGVGDGVRADGAAAVMTSSGAKELDQPGGRMDLSPQGAESSGGVEHEAEGSQGGPAAATPAAAPLSTEPPQAQQQQETLVVDWSSEDETITKARTERREQPESPTATQLPGLSRPGDRAGRPRTGASPPPPSPPASPARSSSSNSRPSSPESVGSKQPAKSVGDDSDSTFDGSDENSSASESEVDGWDSDEHERDFPPPPCFLHHKDRPTYKQALCWECYNEYMMLQKANIDISDVDSDIGRRDKKSASGGSRRTADGGKRPRKSRGSSSGSNSSSEERRKRHKVVGASSATASSSASASGRRLVKPHRKKAKKLAAGNDEAVSNAMLWEETSLSSEGGGEGERSLRVAKGKHKRVSEKPRTNNSSKAHSIIPRKKKQGSGPAPPRQQQGKRAKLARQRSQDAVGRPGSRDGWPTPAAGSDGRGPPQLARGGSLGTATRSLSLSQYRVRKGATGLLLSSSPRTLGKSVTGLKAAVAGQNIGEGHAQQISKTPTVESSTDIGVNRGISNHTPAMPVPAPSNKLNDKYEKVDHFNGVRRKKSNGKYFVWAESGPLDGRPYDTADECAKAYDQLFYPPSAPGNQNRHRPDFGDARAPSHVDSGSLTGLVGSQGSRLSKGTLTSGYKQPRRTPFFAPTEETTSHPQAAPAPPRHRPARAARGQHSQKVAARPAPCQPPQAGPPRGVMEVVALVDGPSTKRSGTTSLGLNASLPPVTASTAPAPPRHRPARAARGHQSPKVAARPAPCQPPQAGPPRGVMEVVALVDGPSTKRSGTTSLGQNASLPSVAASPAPAPPRHRPARAARGKQPPQAVPPNGAAEVVSSTDGPSAGRCSTVTHGRNAPLPIIAAFNAPQSSRVTWKEPLEDDQHLNGKCLPPKASVLPKRSALAASKAVPDTRATCAQSSS